MDNKVGEGIVLGEVLRREVAGGFFAQPDQVRRVLPEQLPAQACEVKVRDRPGTVVETSIEQEHLDVALVTKTTDCSIAANTTSCSAGGNKPRTIGATFGRVTETVSASDSGA
ncbi:MAG: hypothetical protein ACLP59_04055 [Bryobacteraceae bacterium]